MGAGLIGRRHIEHILAEDCSALVAIIDPASEARALAEQLGVPWYPDFAAMSAVERPDGIIVATPNRMHLEHGLEVIAAGLPVLIEKPITDDVADGERLVEAAERAGVALMVGHHRRHNPLIHAAREAIASGKIGKIVAVHGTCWMSKPDSYFDAPWRREKGAGPILVNLIHDIDLLRHLCGEIRSVQAMESNALRGNAVEETAVMLLQFESGALGTMTVSDSIAAPWSWEFTSGENAAYTHTPETCYMIGGTRGSLTVPYLDLWQHPGEPDWFTPLARVRLPVAGKDPLGLQVRNLCEVIRGTALPVVTGQEGLNTLRVIAAVKQAAATGGRIDVG